nr:hypothetical protein [Tanacetum cinerariifolium]
KDHPLEQVIGEPSRPVLTRNQLRSDGDMCIFALTGSACNRDLRMLIPFRGCLLVRRRSIIIKGSCTSLVELEFSLEEVYKAMTDQLDWVNPKGHQYPHNLLKPLPLISNSQGRCVIPFDHFINNDLEYLRGGASSCKYTTSVTKTKATDYGHIKWIEDLFYGFSVNRESARDVYSKRRIIAVTELKIFEWHNYKYLDWITVRRDDDKLFQGRRLQKAPHSRNRRYVTASGSRKADKSDSRRTLCFQCLFLNIYKKHRNPKACGRPLTQCPRGGAFSDNEKLSKCKSFDSYIKHFD